MTLRPPSLSLSLLHSLSVRISLLVSKHDYDNDRDNDAVVVVAAASAQDVNDNNSNNNNNKGFSCCIYKSYKSHLLEPLVFYFFLGWVIFFWYVVVVVLKICCFSIRNSCHPSVHPSTTKSLASWWLFKYLLRRVPSWILFRFFFLLSSEIPQSQPLPHIP